MPKPLSLAEFLAPLPLSCQALFFADLETRFADRALRNGDSVGLVRAIDSARGLVHNARLLAHLERCDAVEQCDAVTTGSGVT